jgi:hypothetical protein
MPQITIGGDVNMIGWEGKRISIWENIHSNGKDYSRLWTCWFDTPQIQLQEQDFVEISGELSTKIGKYTPKGQTEEKVVVEHHIQGAFIKSQVSKKQQAENLAQFEEMPF